MDAKLAKDHDQQFTEEDYIDMDLSFASNFLSSPPNSIDFEFKMSSNTVNMQPLTSPADELFYNGKLLPLHSSPCKQMAEKMLRSPRRIESFNFSTPATPSYISYNDFNPGSKYYYHECSEQEDFVQAKKRKQSWSKKLNFITKSNFSSRLKASTSYLKSIFRKNGSSDSNKVPVSRTEKFSNDMRRDAESQASDATGDMKSGGFVVEEKMEGGSIHRRSFSGAIKWQLSSKSSSFSLSSSTSSSSSLSSVNFDELCGVQPVLKRSSSVNSDIESSIQGAIAYCKRSQLERV